MRKQCCTSFIFKHKFVYKYPYSFLFLTKYTFCITFTLQDLKSYSSRSTLLAYGIFHNFIAVELPATTSLLSGCKTTSLDLFSRTSFIKTNYFWKPCVENNCLDTLSSIIRKISSNCKSNSKLPTFSVSLYFWKISYFKLSKIQTIAMELIHEFELKNLLNIIQKFKNIVSLR